MKKYCNDCIFSMKSSDVQPDYRGFMGFMSVPFFGDRDSELVCSRIFEFYRTQTTITKRYARIDNLNEKNDCKHYSPTVIAKTFYESVN